MIVLRPCIYKELLRHLTSKRSLGQHSLHRMLYDKFRLLRKLFLKGNLLQAADIAAVSFVYLLIKFFPVTLIFSALTTIT